MIKKKITAVLLVLGILFTSIPLQTQAATSAVYSGNCGTSGVTWELNKSTGELKISGNGEIQSVFDWSGYKGMPVDTVKSIYITAGITGMAQGALGVQRWNNLEKITVASNSPYLKSVNGILFNKQGTKILKYPNKRSTDYTVPSGVTEIGNRAFAQCTLKRITIPQSVSDIWQRAFFCSSITNVDGAKGLERVYPEAFAYSRLANITFSQGLQQIGAGAFENTDLTSVSLPAGIIYIGLEAFGYNAKLKKVVSNSALGPKVGNYNQSGCSIFTSCHNLTDVTMTNNVGSFAFNDCTSLKNVTLKEGVNYIGVGAFTGDEGITEMYLPKSLNGLEESAFVGCANIQKYTVHAENNWFCSQDGVLFSKNKRQLISYPPGKKSGKTYQIPDTVTEITGWSFSFLQGNSLEEILIPFNVTKIGQGAFAGSSSLKRLVIPYTVNEIWQQAVFYECTGLEYIVFPKTEIKMDYDAAINKCNCTGLKKIYGYTSTILSTEDGSRKSLKEWAGNKFVSLDNGIELELNANGGKVSSNSKRIYPAYAYGSLPVPSRTGYAFTGWYTAASGGTQVSEKDQVRSVTKQTLYAHWKQADKQTNSNTKQQPQKNTDGQTDQPPQKQANGQTNQQPQDQTKKKNTVSKIAAPKTSIRMTDSRSLDVSWKKINGAKGYVVYCTDKKNGKYKKVKQTTRTKAHFKNLKKGKTYYYKVKAYKKVNGKVYYGYYSKKVSRQIKGKVSTPIQNKIRADKKKGTVIFSWKTVQNAQKMQILMSTNGGKSYKVWKTVSAKKGKAEYSYRDSFKKSREYRFKLRAYYSVDKIRVYSQTSNEWRVKIKN